MRVPDSGIMELRGMHFHAHHGVLESERTQGNEFKVDFSAEFNPSAAAVTDNLDDTVNYGEIYSLVRSEMEIPSRLLENVAWRILNSVQGAFPQLSHISVTVSKRNPPVGGEVEWSSITVRG